MSSDTSNGAGNAWDEECDFLVVGSGAGAMVGALVAATNGLRTMLIEKTEVFGGTTAYSGGGMWLPNNHVELRGGVPDDPALVRSYVDATVGDRTPRSLQDAFLQAAPEVIEYLEQNPCFEFEWRPFPDYFDTDGSFPDGRSIYALQLPASELGDQLALLRNPLPVERYGMPPTEMLLGGRALLGRLLLALARTDADLRTDTALESLIDDDGSVVGALVSSGGRTLRIKANRGVLLACGGFERNAALRQQHGVPEGTTWTQGAPGNTGDGLLAATAVGADTDLLEECWWAPGLVEPGGTAQFMIGLRAGIIVNKDGQRFANEVMPYDRFGHEMIKAAGTAPFHLILDHDAIDQFGLGRPEAGIVPGKPIPQAWFDSGSLVRADTLDELAALLGLAPDQLRHTVDEFNQFARDGADPQFHRGDEPFDTFFSRPAGDASKTLRPIEQGPFYAASVVLADLGTKGGLRTDGHGQVVGVDGQPLHGLYAAGNTMASWTGHVYPGPGSPIGSCMVFSYLAAQHASELATSNA